MRISLLATKRLMKKILGFVSLIFFCAASFGQELNVMTFNIRLNISSDSLNAWPYRKDKVVSQIIYHRADILGVQEAVPGQMADLKTALSRYSYVGVGREGGNKGEYSAIFYKTERFALLGYSTFWLSRTPAIVASIGWDAALPRIVTWAKFKERKSGKSFYVFNTHFDHMGKVARRESARLLLQAVDSIAGRSIAIVTGDFNAQPDDEPMQIIMNPSTANHLVDAQSVSIEPHYGPTGTFNGFGIKETSDKPIDYILFNRRVQVLQHATISQAWMGRYASDHFAVLAKIKLL